MESLSLRWRLVVLVLASVLTAQAIGLGILLLAPPPASPGISVEQAREALTGMSSPPTLVRRVSNTLPPELERPPGGTAVLVRAMLASALSASPQAVRVALLEPDGPPLGAGAAALASGTPRITVMRPPTPGSGDAGALQAAGGQGIAMAQALLRETPYPPFMAAVRGTDGRWTIVEPAQPLLSPWRVRVLAAFGLSALLLIPAAWWSARRLTRPMVLFAEAAERLGLDPGADPLPVKGPQEVRAAAASINRMQERLRGYVEGRTAMVAAIAHDLRTPLTGLRLRAETAPPAERARMVEDIGRMESMIAQVLAFVRGEQVREARERIDLCALAQECVLEAAERGEAASLQRCAPTMVTGERLNLRRAIANLVTNAANYGGAARISVGQAEGWAVLTVEDDGPGIPPEWLERVLEPFRRLEPSRSRSTGGVGLGLASAVGIVRAHKGTLALRNLPERGLAAEIRLPLAD